MMFEVLFFYKYQHATCWLLLILGSVLFITPSYSHENCTKIGSFLCHPNDLSKFYVCVGKGLSEVMSCAPPLHFDPILNVCNWPGSSDCSEHIQMSSTSTSTPRKLTTKFEVSSRKENTGLCYPENCKLPNCKCPGPEIPNSLLQSSTPQIILLTFDDGINSNIIEYYRDLFGSNITNPNGCPINATFFVSGDWVDYSYVKELYNDGHEIASHSKTHQFPIDYWLTADYNSYVDEIVGMKTLLTINAHVPAEDIRGMRSPFLSIGGDNQFKVLQDYGFQYDSSMVTGTISEKDLVWPFTLDYQVNNKYCTLKICPNKTYPGVWEVPLLRWYNDEGMPFGMADEYKIPQDSPAVGKYLKDNFNRHYKTNKAPLGICLHAPWLIKHINPLKKFLEEVSMKEDVWIVSVSQALQWIRNPVPLNNISQFESWNCK